MGGRDGAGGWLPVGARVAAPARAWLAASGMLGIIYTRPACLPACVRPSGRLSLCFIRVSLFPCACLRYCGLSVGDKVFITRPPYLYLLSSICIFLAVIFLPVPHYVCLSVSTTVKVRPCAEPV